jgi:predicted RNA methylase
MNNIQNVYEIYIKDQPFLPVIESAIPYHFSNISLFSSGNPEQAMYTANLISSYFKESDIPHLIVTDATSCVGGNTWAFATLFKHVNAVELEKIHSDMLKHNMSLLKLNDKITIYNTNYLDIFSSLKQDIIFLDPPWGGVHYMKK